MAIANAQEVFQLTAHGVGKFAFEDLRGILRIKYYVGQTLPALGLVLLKAGDQFTAVSHVYTATMTPRATADVSVPAVIFTDRVADFFNRDFDASPVVAVEWAIDGSDFPSAGFYDLRFKAVNTGDSKVNLLPMIEVEVVDAI